MADQPSALSSISSFSTRYEFIFPLTATNDQFGHASGDRALQLIAESMREALRETDLLGRIGGEEFATMLPKADDKQVETIAERIRSRVAQGMLFVEGRQVPLSVSVGGVHFKRPVSFSDKHVAADEQLYSAKRGGRNRVEFTNLATACA